MIQKYQGRRFVALIFGSMLLTVGMFHGNPENFGTFAQALGVMVLAYMGGQSATDWKKYSADLPKE